MNKPLLILPVLCMLPALQSCSTEQKAASLPWKITPVMEVRNSTENPEAYYQLGRFYQGQSRHELAAKAFEKAITLDPKYADAHNALGVSYAALGKLDLAVNQFNAAIALDPEVSRFHNNLGYARYLKQDYTPAVAELKKAVALDPNAEKASANYQQALAQAATAPAVAQNTATLPPSGASNTVHAVDRPHTIAPVAASSALAPAKRDDGNDTPATQVAQVQTPPAAIASSDVMRAQNKPAITNTSTTTVTAQKTAPVLTASVTPALPPLDHAKDVATAPEVKPVHVATAPAVQTEQLAENTEPRTSAPQQPAVAVATVAEKAPAANVATIQTLNAPAAVALPMAAPTPINVQNTVAEAKPRTTQQQPMMVSTTAEAVTADPAISHPNPGPIDKKPAPVKAAATIPQQPTSQAKQESSEGAGSVLAFDALKNRRFEIANGNGVTGMARRVSKELAVLGLQSAHLTNQKPFRQPLTFVQYRSGYKELAERLSTQLPNNPPAHENNRLRAGTDVRLVLGKDVARGMTLLYKAHVTEAKLVLNQQKPRATLGE